MKISRRNMMCGAAAASVAGVVLSACSSDKKGDKEGGSNPLSSSEPESTYSLNGFLVTEDGVVKKAPNPDATNIHIFLDLHCPFCAYFHIESKSLVDELIKDDNYNVIFVVLSFLDHHSNDEYSSNSASALVSVAEKSPENFSEFLNSLFMNQPGSGPEYSEVSIDGIKNIAQSVSIPQDVTDTFDSLEYKEWVLSMTEDMIERDDLFSQEANSPDGFSTPSLFAGGTLNSENDRYEGFVRADLEMGRYEESIQEAISEAS